MYYMATNVLKFEETEDKKYKASFQASGKVNVFLDRVDNSDVFVYLYPKGYYPVLFKRLKPERTDVLLELVIPSGGEVNVDIVSGTEVTQACYLTEEETFIYSVPASSVVFDDGDNFQAKLESGELKGDKGDKGDKGVPGVQGVKGDTGATGPQGPAGTNGTNGADGKSVTAISLTTDADGKVTGGTCTLSDSSSIAITVTTTPAS